MNSKNAFKGSKSLITAILVICCIIFVWPSLEGEVVKTALEAYELRMQGKVDEAKSLLEDAIAENPNNADAHYELARVQLHMALGSFGGGGDLNSMIDDAQKSIEKAVEFDAQNARNTFFAGHIYFFQTYLSFMMGTEPNEKLAKATGAFETALKLKPEYHQAALYLVELYSQFPEESGGDRTKAEDYAKKLDEMDNVFGAKARSILLPDDEYKVEYWQKVLQTHNDNSDILEELGKAYLGDDNIDNAVLCFEKAIQIDPEKAYLFLDLSIYYTFQAMGSRDDKDLLQSNIDNGDAAVAKYIESRPVHPMQAYAIGVRSKYKSFSGQKEEAQALFNEAKSLDPYFSKATGAPHPDLFASPGKISQNHRYLMRPF